MLSGRFGVSIQSIAVNFLLNCNIYNGFAHPSKTLFPEFFHSETRELMVYILLNAEYQNFLLLFHAWLSFS